LFHALSRAGEYRVRYDIEEKIPGVELLLADETQHVNAVCAEGKEMRVLVRDKSLGAVGPRSVAALGQWRAFDSKGVGRLTEEPSACRLLAFASMMWKLQIAAIHSPFESPSRAARSRPAPLDGRRRQGSRRSGQGA
jgi:hypothetical protein